MRCAGALLLLLLLLYYVYYYWLGAVRQRRRQNPNPNPNPNPTDPSPKPPLGPRCRHQPHRSIHPSIPVLSLTPPVRAQPIPIECLPTMERSMSLSVIHLGSANHWTRQQQYQKKKKKKYNKYKIRNKAEKKNQKIQQPLQQWTGDGGRGRCRRRRWL